MNIPVVLENLGKGSPSTACTQNGIVANIPQLIPIPRPLTKVNSQIIALFTGTEADSQDASNNVSENASGDATSSNPTLPVVSGQSQGPEKISVVRVLTTVVTTSTVDHKAPTPTALDDSTFGGPGGDLTNEQNDNAFRLVPGAQPSWGSRGIYLSLGHILAAFSFSLYFLI
jgi:hypothetical protein